MHCKIVEVSNASGIRNRPDVKRGASIGGACGGQVVILCNNQGEIKLKINFQIMRRSSPIFEELTT